METTFEIVKKTIQKLNHKINSQKEIDEKCPVVKKQVVKGKMCWILQNPETLKFAVISEEQVDEINNLYHIAKYGMSIDDDPFMLKS